MWTRRDFLLLSAAGLRARDAWPQKSTAQQFGVGVCVGVPGEQAFLSICDQCSGLGLHHIETSGGGQRLVDLYSGRIPSLKDELQQRGLSLAGYAQYSEMGDPAKSADLLELHLRIGRVLRPLGTRYITQLWTPSPKPGIAPDQLLKHLTASDYRNFGRNANEIGKRLQNETGLQMGYHPEQADVAAGLVDRVMEGTDPRYFHFVPDVGHLQAGGMDPLAVYRKYRSRMIATHLRDFDPNAEFERNGQRLRGRFVPLGKGVIQLPELIAFLKTTGFTGQVNAEGGGLAASGNYMTQQLHLEL
jgi:sugar phosphate isomerase/epimerase